MSNKLWKYNDPEWRLRWELGLEDVNEDDLIIDYLTDLNAKDFIFLQNQKTGEIMWHLNSKRGNETYARAWDERLSVICDGLSKDQWDYPSQWSPEHIAGRKYRDTFVLMWTCTIDHKVMSRLDAWANISDYIHRFITRAKQVLKKYFKGAVTFCVKEGSESGYPAPHIVVITEQPIPVVYHYSEKEQGWKWITVDRDINAVLHAIWYDITASTIFDCRGVCQGDTGTSGTVAYYLTKYLGKTVNPKNKTAVQTHTFQKFFRLRDQVGKAFLERLQVGLPQRYKTRLDTYHNELQRVSKIKAVKQRLERVLQTQILHVFIENNIACMIAYYDERISDIMRVIPPPDWVYLDHVRVQNRIHMQQLINRVEEINKHNALIRNVSSDFAVSF